MDNPKGTVINAIVASPSKILIATAVKISNATPFNFCMAKYFFFPGVPWRLFCGFSPGSWHPCSLSYRPGPTLLYMGYSVRLSSVLLPSASCCVPSLSVSSALLSSPHNGGISNLLNIAFSASLFSLITLNSSIRFYLNHL